MNFIQIVTENEIANAFQSISKISPPLAAWQTVEDPRGKMKREVYRFRSLKVNTSMNQIDLIPYDTSKILNSNSALFFMSNYRRSIFKSQLKLNSKEKVIISIPESILLQNTRCEERIKMKNKRVDIEISQLSRKILYSKKVIDQSQDGFSLSNSSKEAVIFEKGQRVKLLANNLNYKIVSISPYYRYRQLEGMRIGLRKCPS